MPLLFSYGTLQRDDVQLATFGRRLVGKRDKLPGFVPSLVGIADSEVVAATGQTHYANATFTGKADDCVSGTAFEVTDADLEAADRYEEPASYKRIAVTLASGRQAWAYKHESILLDAMLLDLRALSSQDIVERTVKNWAMFKRAGAELEARSPSPEAAARVARAYAEGRAPAFLAARLLSCIRDECGYATAHEILLHAPQQLAGSDAGTAMARIRGEGAFDDLCDALTIAPDRAGREGAAWGLSCLGARAVGPIQAASVEGRIRWQTGGTILARLRMDPVAVADLLRSANERAVKLGADILHCALPDGCDDAKAWLGRLQPIVGEPLRRVLASPAVTMAPRKRRALEAWLLTDQPTRRAPS